LNGSFVYAPEVTQSNSNPLFNGYSTSHSQMNWQVMYTHLF
jgi:hypothetical protein